jgi:PRTRC genetic system protein D
MKIRCGIDVGFGDVKIAWYTDQLHTLTFPAILGRAETRSSAQIALGTYRKRIDTIEYGPQTYFTGTQALIESRLIAARQDAERIGSVEERVLMLATLAKANINNAILVTGLPVLWWDKRRRLVKSWTSSHNIIWNNKPMEINIKEVRPVPQPFGSFYSRVLGPDGTAKETKQVMRSGWAVLDIGLNTTDCAGILNLQPVNRWCGGIRRGVRDALDIIAADIEATYGVRRPLHEISAALRTQGHIDIYREHYSVNGNAASALQSLSQEIVGEATRRWGQGDRFHSVLISGGGAALLGKEIAQSFPQNAEILPKPALANAIGFAKFAQRRIFLSDKKADEHK